MTRRWKPPMRWLSYFQFLQISCCLAHHVASITTHQQAAATAASAGNGWSFACSVIFIVQSFSNKYSKSRHYFQTSHALPKISIIKFMSRCRRGHEGHVQIRSRVLSPSRPIPLLFLRTSSSSLSSSFTLPYHLNVELCLHFQNLIVTIMHAIVRRRFLL